jgi:hypothetical protein
MLTDLADYLSSYNSVRSISDRHAYWADYVLDRIRDDVTELDTRIEDYLFPSLDQLFEKK